MNNQFLIGEKIYLRLLVREDAENYYNWLNDQETTKFMQHGIFPTSEDDCKNYIESIERPNILLAIIKKAKYDGGLKSSGKHIGNIALLNIHQTFRTADIALIIGDKQCWGNGYGTESIKLLVDHAFNRMNLNKLKAGAVESNIGSIKAFEKVGFKQDGVMRQEYYCDGKYRNVVIMSLLKDDWRRSKSEDF